MCDSEEILSEEVSDSYGLGVKETWHNKTKTKELLGAF